MRLRIRHETVYRYSQAVTFGPHRLMIRPREEHDRAIESSLLEISPRHSLRWRSDAYGNSVAVVSLLEPAGALRIVSEVVVKQFEPNPFNFLLDPSAENYPFTYSADEAPDLAPCLLRLYPADGTVADWLASRWDGKATPTLSLLTTLNREVRECFSYVRREEPGVQSPAETAARGGGSCRDYAVFLMEACRHLGLAARFVSGYVHNPELDHGTTHAWTEVYLPGAGWRGFDPTAGILACDLHVPVAVARDPAGASPISGSFSAPGECVGMDVDVRIEELP
jgi:transglutaminase-like putative cysteine protease